jgi:AcrR family transcriptional regulator
MSGDDKAQSSRKKRYVERPDIRACLLDAAEALVREEGYAAATARNIASKVGLKHQVIFYYFGSQDELLLEVYRRVAHAQRERLVAAMASDHPVRALWEIASDRDETRFTLEFMALANHNEAIRAELAQNAEAARTLQAEALGQHFQARGINPRLSPQVVALLTTGMARAIVQEAALGIKAGHDEIDALISESLRQFELRGVSEGDIETIVDAMSTHR